MLMTGMMNVSLLLHSTMLKCHRDYSINWSHHCRIMDTPFCLQLCLMLCVCEASFIVHDAVRIRKANITRDREAALDRLNGYTENDFKRRFRMWRWQFDLLVNSIRETLEPQTLWAKQCAINSSGSWVAAELKVAATLRVLAGGSYLDASDLYAVSASSFHRNTFWPVVLAICNCKLPCLVGIPFFLFN